jgi:hypothetical protein
MVKSKASGPQVKSTRESKRTHKPKLIFDPSDSGEQHAASKTKAPEKDQENVTEEKNECRGVKKTIVKTSKVCF